MSFERVSESLRTVTKFDMFWEKDNEIRESVLAGSPQRTACFWHAYKVLSHNIAAQALTPLNLLT